MQNSKPGWRAHRRDGHETQERRLKPSVETCDMERYAVRITDEALEDMENVYRYIAERLQSPENAARQYNRIADGILELEVFPERCRLVDFEPERESGLRRLLVDNYSVFYFIREDQVIVTNVLYSASDIEQRLKEKNQ